jgi:putative intracellular protease/amidase
VSRAMKVLCILPSEGYDPTESGVPWQALTDGGFDVWFATPEGKPSPADPRLVDIGFGLLNPVLMTRANDLATYRAMVASPRWNAPLAFDAVKPAEFEGLLIPGGHESRMRTLLESETARTICMHFFASDKPVAAICHGVLLAARTIDPSTGASVLRGRTTTCLPRTMELGAWAITAPVLGRYYRTYDVSVEAEVADAVTKSGSLLVGPLFAMRDTKEKRERGFVVRDGRYVTARWPGDAHAFAQTFVEVMRESASA